MLGNSQTEKVMWQVEREEVVDKVTEVILDVVRGREVMNPLSRPHITERE